MDSAGEGEGGKTRELCLILYTPMDCNPPGSSVHESQARILEWVAMPSSRGFSQPRDQNITTLS